MVPVHTSRPAWTAAPDGVLRSARRHEAMRRPVQAAAPGDAPRDVRNGSRRCTTPCRRRHRAMPTSRAWATMSDSTSVPVRTRRWLENHDFPILERKEGRNSGRGTLFWLGMDGFLMRIRENRPFQANSRSQSAENVSGMPVLLENRDFEAI